MNTPWGKSDSKHVYGEGVVFYSTPGHGGFKINRKQLEAMPRRFRNEDGWYEEDCEAIKVYVAFPHLFPQHNPEEMKKWCNYYFDENGDIITGEEREKTKDPLQV